MYISMLSFQGFYFLKKKNQELRIFLMFKSQIELQNKQDVRLKSCNLMEVVGFKHSFSN